MGGGGGGGCDEAIPGFPLVRTLNPAYTSVNTISSKPSRCHQLFFVTNGGWTRVHAPTGPSTVGDDRSGFPPSSPFSQPPSFCLCQHCLSVVSFAVRCGAAAASPQSPAMGDSPGMGSTGGVYHQRRVDHPRAVYHQRHQGHDAIRPGLLLRLLLLACFPPPFSGWDIANSMDRIIYFIMLHPPGMSPCGPLFTDILHRRY